MTTSPTNYLLSMTTTPTPHSTNLHHFTKLATSINTKLVFSTFDYSNSGKAAIMHEVVHNNPQR
jgi:hypothetical protein